jgi:hypothetical protein
MKTYRGVEVKLLSRGFYIYQTVMINQQASYWHKKQLDGFQDPQ